MLYDEIQKEFPYNIIQKLSITVSFLTEDQVNGFSYMFSLLPIEEQALLEDYYESKLSMVEIAERYELLSYRRVVPTIKGIIKKLNSVKFLNYLTFGKTIYLQLLEETEQRKEHPSFVDFLLQCELSEIDLSPRLYNILMRYNICNTYTLYQISTRGDWDSDYYGIGVGCMEEIKNIFKGLEKEYEKVLKGEIDVIKNLGIITVSDEEIEKRIQMMFEKCSNMDECSDYDCEKCNAVKKAILRKIRNNKL